MNTRTDTPDPRDRALLVDVDAIRDRSCTSLDKLLNLALSPRHVWLHRVDFAIKHLMDSNSEITRENVEWRAAAIYGPCPAD
jgi:hypothetical protein